mmetsp:Transcript_21467/g.53237  ORF Transcript_21467/g.53237 Transcript_21467/m.53237 type:complete len:82 (+) Transcript_21467:755-1000(+)
MTIVSIVTSGGTIIQIRDLFLTIKTMKRIQLPQTSVAQAMTKYQPPTTLSTKSALKTFKRRGSSRSSTVNDKIYFKMDIDV